MNEKTPIRSMTGATRTGAPLSLSRAPAKDLQPWLYWFSIAEGTLPDGYQAHCHLLDDHPCIRLLYGGVWTAETRDGHRVYDPGNHGITLFMGPQTKALPISVTGSYTAITLHFTAGGPQALGGPQVPDMLDRILDFDELTGDGRLTEKIPLSKGREKWLLALEDIFRDIFVRSDTAPPSLLSHSFEKACLANPGFAISEFASDHNVTLRKLERQIKKDFGLSPKQVQRRARAQDMAAILLGVALAEEEVEMRSRYFDQSHLIREIRYFFHQVPGNMERGDHPFLRLNMESRQSRRFDVLNALGSDTHKAWRDPSAEPAQPIG
ncbi:MAG: hypothetical protein ACK5NN_11570 [Sphingomonadaceae bacterium]